MGTEAEKVIPNGLTFNLSTVLGLIVSGITICTIIFQTGALVTKVEGLNDREVEHYSALGVKIDNLTKDFVSLKSDIELINKRLPSDFEARFSQISEWYYRNHEESK